MAAMKLLTEDANRSELVHRDPDEGTAIDHPALRLIQQMHRARFKNLRS